MRLLNINEVRQRTGLSRASIYRLEGSGEFPARRKVAANRIAWVDDEIDAWIEQLPTAGVENQKAAQGGGR